MLLHTALVRYARLHSMRSSPVSKEDLEDLASTKSLDLLSRTESGMWNTKDRSGPEIAGYLSTVAKNGLLDLLHQRRRFEQRPESNASEDSAGDRHAAPFREHPSSTEAPGIAHERAAFAQALIGCVGSLQDRARKIWMLRVFFDLPSKEIAEHPEVRLKASHVDVLLQRTRQTVRECMLSKGFEPSEMPPGSFAEVWQHLYGQSNDEREPWSMPGGAI
ncbi:MAG: sigma-70 family RNA polymerase sigma factor [Candidatus Eisenbacteria bacterium]